MQVPLRTKREDTPFFGDRRALRRAEEEGKAGGLVPEGPLDRGAMETAPAEITPMEKER